MYELLLLLSQYSSGKTILSFLQSNVSEKAESTITLACGPGCAELVHLERKLLGQGWEVVLG